MFECLKTKIGVRVQLPRDAHVQCPFDVRSTDLRGLISLFENSNRSFMKSTFSDTIKRSKSVRSLLDVPLKFDSFQMNMFVSVLYSKNDIRVRSMFKIIQCSNKNILLHI